MHNTRAHDIVFAIKICELCDGSIAEVQNCQPVITYPELNGARHPLVFWHHNCWNEHKHKFQEDGVKPREITKIILSPLSQVRQVNNKSRLYSEEDKQQPASASLHAHAIAMVCALAANFLSCREAAVLSGACKSLRESPDINSRFNDKAREEEKVNDKAEYELKFLINQIRCQQG